MERNTPVIADLPPVAGLVAAIEPVLAEAAGEGGRAVTLLSLTLDRPGAPPAASLEVEAWVERATRTLVFAAAEARAGVGGPLVASASAVFRVD